MKITINIETDDNKGARIDITPRPDYREEEASRFSQNLQYAYERMKTMEEKADLSNPPE